MKKFIWSIIILVVVVISVYFVWFNKIEVVETSLELKRPLVVGVVSWPGYAGGIVANNGFEPNIESLFYKKYGLQVRFVLIEDMDARGKSFMKGGPDGVDVMWSTIDFWASELPNFLAGGEAKALMQVDWSQGGDAIVANQDIKTINDLKGKKIALVQYTPSHWLLENLLNNSSLSGIDKAEIRKNLIFSQDVPTARAAFIAGQADAAVVWEPDVSAALVKKGAHILASSNQNKELIADIMVAKADFIKKNPQTIEAFIRGWFDGVDKAKDNKDLAVKLLMENEPLFNELGADITKQSLDWVKWTKLEDNVRIFGLDGKQSVYDKIFTEANKFWLEQGAVEVVLNPEDSKDDTFLRKIYGESQE
ncbi:MAG: Outer membrane protein/peptidoglycan-associated lipoprotein [Candidatus Magasanikbacteria bacterium GW2011_GWC2_37_14]|uniref:Outer membrane protein/peptidoglycan-associated lipoprotein n=1 Tax=Candidatus Magasanikbacteria bacterium GW2011_GWC2_37_14 TaxID=1619046 RepID=A0A0G0JJK7_9BACT|nr:MAG: Outer membrane protein/peptidoglycan-associated lipoprotein [Candidatus Magasanikbacteria bacterium GW2011_GWC2_37_14]